MPLPLADRREVEEDVLAQLRVGPGGLLDRDPQDAAASDVLDLVRARVRARVRDRVRVRVGIRVRARARVRFRVRFRVGVGVRVRPLPSRPLL